MADERATPLPSGTLRRRAETMPSVTLERSPSGLPRASTMSPTSTCEESANVAGRGRAPTMRITARSFATSRPTAVAGWLSPEASVTTNRVAFPTTCALVTTSPRASKTTPEPRSCGVRIWTTDGETALTTLTRSCCSEVDPAADASGATLVTSSPGSLLPHAATTTATPASATVIRCLVMASIMLAGSRPVVGRLAALSPAAPGVGRRPYAGRGACRKDPSRQAPGCAATDAACLPGPLTSSVSADLPTRQLGSEGCDLGDGRPDVRDSTLRQLLLEIAPVLLTVDQPDVLGLVQLELEEPETVVEVGR